jgi:hypothetical protein
MPTGKKNGGAILAPPIFKFNLLYSNRKSEGINHHKKIIKKKY